MKITATISKALIDAKEPVVSALHDLKKYAIISIRDFIYNEDNMKHLASLDNIKRLRLNASIDNYKILKQALFLLKKDNFNPEVFGNLLKAHHANLRDGLNISTTSIEKIFYTSYENGALGGKINGSGGGGCAFVYAHDEYCSKS